MTPSTTTTLSPTSETASVAPVTTDRPTVSRSSVPALVLGSAVLTAVVGIAVAGAVLVRTSPQPVEPATAAAPAASVPFTSTVGDASHGGPGSRADALPVRVAPPSLDATVAGELSHGGPGSRSDLVRPSAPATTVEPVADVAHGTAGSVVVTTAARA